MSIKEEIQAILDALDTKRNEMLHIETSDVTSCRLEREIRNLRYCLENTIRKLINKE